jgi:penicillin-binding protein 2
MHGHPSESLPVTGMTRRTLLCAATASLLPGIHPFSARSMREQTSLDDALSKTPASAVVLHEQTGKVLAERGNADAANTPGSVLKPLLLFGALQQNLVSATTTVFCRRDLRIGNRAYPCTHPQSNVSFAAEEALAYSCNTWFASLALRFTPSRLLETLRAFRLHSGTMPTRPEQNQLIALGLAGVTTSPLQIATAYRILRSQLGESFAKPVVEGLRDSVAFGMAHNAETPDVEISGKTGTADKAPREPWSHGWFAGFGKIHGTPLVIGLYLPQGNGADAANLARDFFLSYEKTTV